MLTKKTDYEFWIEAAFFVIVGVSVVVLMLTRGLDSLGDLPGNWRYCAYAVRGFDPYSYMEAGIIPEQAKDLGLLPETFTATPWGLLLGNLYYFGFTDINSAKIYFYILCPVMLLITCTCLYWKAGKICDDKKFAVLVLLMALSSTDFFISIHSHNASGIISCLLLMAWVFRGDHPILVGVFLGIAMSKPQEAALICFTFLLQKRFMPLIVGALVDIAAWLWVSLHTGTGMFELLVEFLNASHRFAYAFTNPIYKLKAYYGIFTNIVADPSTAMTLSMVVGIIFVAFFWYLYSKHKDAPKVFDSCWAYMASVFWCYSTSSNHYTLALPSIVSLYIMTRQEKLRSRIFWFICCCYTNFSEIFRSNRLSAAIAGHIVEIDTRITIRNIYYLGLIALGVMIYFALTRDSRKKILPAESA